MGNIELEVPRRKQIFQQNKYNAHVSSRTPSSRPGRVTDFNDFLKEIKRHMHETPTSEKENESESSEELVLKFRLQNQRVELEKYRRMVERELGRTYSVESIQIEKGEEEKQNKVRIQFQATPQKGVIARNNVRESDRTIEESNQQSQYLTKSKKVYRQLRGRMQVLEQLINLYEKKPQPFPFAKNQLSMNEMGAGEGGSVFQGVLQSQMSKISGLFNNLTELQSKQATLASQIKEVIQLNGVDSSQQSSGVFHSKQS